MTLQQLRRAALGRYGLLDGYFGDEDEAFPLPLLTDRLNDNHRRIAELTRCYRETQTYDLPVASSGLSTIALNCNVIEVVPGTVRALQGGVWGELAHQPEYEQRYGSPFDSRASGTALYYYLHVGATVGGQRVMEVAPGLSTAITSGLRLDAYIYPARLTASTEAPALQVAEHPVLVTACCQAMAEIEVSRGVDGAAGKWQMWSAKLETEIADLRRVMEGFENPGGRRIRCVDDCN